MTNEPSLPDAAASPAEPPRVSEVLKNAAVLLVDDSRTMRAVLKRSLANLGFTNVTEAVDGGDAVGKMHEQSFDLVLLDMEMPIMGGMEVLATINVNPALKGVPVIVISGADQTERAVQCIEAGAEDYLTKPPNLTLLRARVSTSLEKKRLRDLERLRLLQLQAEK